MHGLFTFFSHLVVQSQISVNDLNLTVIRLNHSSHHLYEVVFCPIQFAKIEVTQGKFFINKNFTKLVFTSEGTFQKKLQSSLGVFMILKCHFTAGSHSKRIALYIKSLFIIIGFHYKNDLCTIGYTFLILLTNEIAVSNTRM